MAHYCELDKDNKVLRVISVSNSACVSDSVGKISVEKGTVVEWEDEAKGIAFCENLLGGRWIRTSYNGNIRRRHAGIGYTYDEGRDAFITPQPYPSWTLDKVGDWQPPIAKPDDGDYSWDEKAGEWIELIEDIVVVSQ